MLRRAHPKKKKEIPKAVAIEALFDDFLRLASKTRVHKQVKYAKYSELALEGRLYKVLLEMHALLEEYAPPWYSETLHRRAEAIIREYSPRATSNRNKTNLSFLKNPTHPVH